MATKTTGAKKRKRTPARKGVMATLAKGMVGLYGRVKQRLARKKPGAKKPAATKKPAKSRGRRRTRKGSTTS